MDLMAVLGLGVAAATAASVWFAADRRLLRRIRRVAPWRIDELPEDRRGRICGRVAPCGELLRAPLTGRRCVFYRVRVVEDDVAVLVEERGVPFVLDDGSGRAIVVPDFTEAALHHVQVGAASAGIGINRREAALLARHGQAPNDVVGPRALAFEEALIAPDESITVVGQGTREPDTEALPADPYRGAKPSRLRLASSPRHPLLITDEVIG